MLIFLFNKPCIFEFAGRLGSVKVLCLARAQKKVFGSHLISCVVHTSGVTEQRQKGEEISTTFAQEPIDRENDPLVPQHFIFQLMENNE